MSDYRVFSLIEDKLKSLLDADGILSGMAPKPEVLFGPPPKESPTNGIKIYLFLYHIVENVYLKNEDSERIDNTHLKKPPMYLDLYYLVIPYGSGNNKVLGRIMQIFYDNAIMRGEELGLKEKDEEIKVLFNSISLDDLTKIWSSCKEAGYVLSVSYIITPVRIDSTITMDVHRMISS
jgi:hypothetical protein